MVYKDEDFMRQLMQAFQGEAPEHLQTLNQTLLRIERKRVDGAERTELLQSAFRAAHSLKGAARAVGFMSIEALSHGIEDVLKLARDAGLLLDPVTCDILYQAFDMIQKLLNGEQPDIEPLTAKLASVGKSATPAPAATAVPEIPAIMAVSPVVDEEMPVQSQPVMVESEETIRVAVSKLDLLMAQAGELMTARISAEERLAEIKSVRGQLNEFPRLWQDVKRVRHDHIGDDVHAAESMRQLEEFMHSLTRTVNRLDNEMNRDALRLGMVSGRLQTEMRRVRMVPFQTLEPLFQRTVRDAARLEDKTVELRLEGGEVELDKKVLEALKDAFLHILRNAVSHGIETPDVRAAGQKAAAGEICISIVQRGSEAHITIRDDGKGFDLERLRRTAGNGIGADASTNDIVNLAFLPGVTTSDHLTALSGRGVGLDVVRRQIESLQGRIRVDNQPGQGAAFQLTVPVSLAMTRVLLVKVDSQRYALPVAAIDKIIRLKQAFNVRGQTMLTLDDEPVPVVSLAQLLNVPASPVGTRLAVIIRSGEQQIALLVDDVLTEQELAVKPSARPLVRVRHVAGVALPGDGVPVAVLNPSDMVKAARGMSVGPVIAPVETVREAADATRRILVVDDSITTRTLEKNILEAAGYEVITATDGLRALNQLKLHPVALVVADVEMPNMDGISLTRHLRDSKEYAELPVILVTSLESKEDRERGMIAGANAYMVKRGFNQAELLETIQHLL